MMQWIGWGRRSGHSPGTAAAMTVAIIGIGLISTPPALGQEAPFTGVVLNKNVPVRSGTGSAFYQVGEVERGTIVEVEDISWGWYQIKPPEGVHSYVSKAFVDATGGEGGKVGRVNSELAKVKAAHLSGPGQSYKVHAVLQKGASVRILGEEGSYYKIIPPDNAPVFLPPGSVKPEASQEAQQILHALRETEGGSPDVQPEEQKQPAQDEQPASSSNVGANAPADVIQDTQDTQDIQGSAELTMPLQDSSPTVEAGGAENGTEDPMEAGRPTASSEAADMEPAASEDDAGVADAPTATVDAAGDDDVTADEGAAEPGDTPSDVAQSTETATADLANGVIPDSDTPIVTPAVSEQLKQVERTNIPLFMRPLEQQPLDQMIAAYEQLEGADLPAVDQRIIRLRLAALRRNKALAETLARINQAQQSTEAEKAAEPPTRLTEDPEVDYDAVGKLLASGVYDGKTLPRMLRLVDPATGRTLAYIKPGQPIVAHKMLGEVVGIVGSKQYNDVLKLQMIDVEQASVLRAAAADDE